MTTPRRARTGVRRDGEVRIIRADEVRYPGVELPGTNAPDDSADEYDQWRADRRTLRPARDTGLALEGRRLRESRRRAAQKRQQVIAGFVAVAVLGALALGWQYSSDRRAATKELAVGLSESSLPLIRTGGPTAEHPVARAANPMAPTPYFASYKSLKLRLPVSVADLTEVGFHQASFAYARHLKTPLPNADLGDVEAARTSHRDKSKQPTVDNAWLVGEVLRMWRDRPGRPDNAADVGADPGSPVYAPVSGTVVKVKKYKLYGKWNDYEVHIQPDGHRTLDLVMIHVDKVTALPGDHVMAGITQVAVVRKLPKAVGPQLRTYTKNGGHHTHIQVNDATDPSYKGLKDAITVDGSTATSSTRQPVR